MLNLPGLITSCLFIRIMCLFCNSLFSLFLKRNRLCGNFVYCAIEKKFEKTNFATVTVEGSGKYGVKDVVSGREILPQSFDNIGYYYSGFFTAKDNTAIRRRRECPECGSRFTTFERIQLRDLIVVKKNGEKVMFGRLYPTVSYAAGVGVCLLNHFLIDLRFVSRFNKTTNYLSYDAATDGTEFKTTTHSVQLKVGFLF